MIAVHLSQIQTNPSPKCPFLNSFLTGFLGSRSVVVRSSNYGGFFRGVYMARRRLHARCL
ncbi:unnamed protein product [Camellia sinensis]